LEKQAILVQSSLYQSADADLRSQMKERSRTAKLPVGTFYIHEGDTVENFAIVGEGQLRVFKTGESGREITLYTVNPGESCLLNITSIMSNTPSPATAQAVSPVQALLFPAKLLKSWIEERSIVREFIFGTLATRVATMMSLVEEITFRKIDRRLAEFLIERAENKTGVVPTIAMTHEQIASELGTAREVVSRVLKEFERQGVVRLQRGQITLIDGENLKQAVY